MSRRLGRPAKKKEGDPEDSDRRVQKRVKLSKKRAVSEGSLSAKGVEGEGDGEGEGSVGGSLQTPTPLLGETSFPGSFHPFLHPFRCNADAVDNMDFGSDAWLQDFVSAQSVEVQDQDLFDSLDSSKDAFPAISADPAVLFPSPADTDLPNYFQPESTFPNPDVPADYMTTSPATAAPMPVNTDYPRINPVESIPGSFLSGTEQSSYYSDDFTLPFETPSLDFICQSQCQCDEQAIRELVRVNLCASRATQSSIDTILTCQRGLQQLADTILQCGICSRTRVNLLIIVIVSVDSLLSTLEAATSATRTGAYGSLSDEEIGGFDLPIPVSGRRYSGTSAPGGFKAQVEACPLQVGSFRIPPDEKYCFVKQLFHAKLSGLLATIRRIRFCAQQILAASSSRGRLIMMMETDRRLQLIMTKIKMLSR